MNRQFIAFIGAGGIAAAVNWSVNLALHQIMPLEASVVVAYMAGMTTAFVLTRIFVFAGSGRAAHDEYIRFAIVNMVALAQVWGVTIVLARIVLPSMDWTFHPEAVSHLVGVASPIVTSYFGHKYFTFARVRAKKPDDSVEDQQ
jgi:putative flippase GtrA